MRNAAIDGIQVAGGAHDVTVSWSILGAIAKNMLLKYGASAITLHHNALAASATLSPQVRIDDTT